MERFYTFVARWLTDSTEGTTEDFEIYKYGVQIGIEQLLYIVTCISISLILSEIRPMLLLISVLYLVRSYIGGFHLKSFLSCYFFSVLSSVLIIFLSRVSIESLDSNVYIVNIVLLVVSYIGLVMQSKDIEALDYNFYIKKLRMNLIIILAIITVLKIFNLEQENRVIAYTFVLIICSLIIQQLKNNLSFKKL